MSAPRESVPTATDDAPLTLAQAVVQMRDDLAVTCPTPELDGDGNRIGPDSPAAWDGMDDDPQTVPVDLEAAYVLLDHARVTTPTEPIEGEDRLDVVLFAAPDRADAIREVRGVVPGLGLREAEAIVDAVPAAVVAGVSAWLAHGIVDRLTRYSDLDVRVLGRAQGPATAAGAACEAPGGSGRCQMCGDIVELVVGVHRDSSDDTCPGTVTKQWERPDHAPEDAAGLRARLYAALTTAGPLVRRGVLNRWHDLDAPEAETIAAVVAAVVQPSDEDMR